MEKILLLINHDGINKSALDFACYLADLTRSSLCGLFIDPGNAIRNKTINMYTGTPEQTENTAETHWKTKLGENKNAFALACNNKSIRMSDEHSSISGVDDLVAESRFADILIINSDCRFHDTAESIPSSLAKDILSKSECPVIVAPQSFDGIEEIVLAYDGSSSSVYAIKQFTYLFPELSETRMIFLQVLEKNESEIANFEQFKDYLKAHYSAIGFSTLHGRPEDELFTYFLKKKNAFIITGAFGRNNYLPFIQRSTAELLLKTTSHPVFIAHR